MVLLGTDTVGIAEYYWFADIHKMTEDTPSSSLYQTQRSHPPIFHPIRALTVNGYPNVLVAGKCMATSFFVNAATRVHPNEYTSGVAAGVAAEMM